MVEGVDFIGRPTGAALAAAGKRFVIRYVPYGGYSKGLTASEVADYHAHGIAIVLVWEQVATRALQGFAAGAADATTSRNAAAVLGFPADRPVYMGVDFDTNSTQWPALEAYFAGAVSVLSLARTGVYGETALLAHLQAKGLASWYWQTSAWSGGAVFANRHLLQYLNDQTINGVSVDLDRAFKADYGQWPKEAPMTAISSYLPGYTAVVKPTSNIRSDAKLSATVLRTVGTAAETWTIIGLVKGDTDSDCGGNDWLVTWANGRYEYTSKCNVTSGPTAPAGAPAPAPDCGKAVDDAVGPLNVEITALSAQVAALQTTAAGEPARVSAALAADRDKAHVVVSYE